MKDPSLTLGIEEEYQVVDPETQDPAITKVYLRDELRFQQEAEIGPDMVIVTEDWTAK